MSDLRYYDTIFVVKYDLNNLYNIGHMPSFVVPGYLPW